MLFDQNWLGIKQILDGSKKEIHNDTLYVGCSVAAQLLPYNRDNQLTTNASTHPIGNYFLVKNAIENNKHIHTVIYLSVPDMLGQKLATERTYNYFVKPFYTFENKDEINSSAGTKAILSRNPALFLCVLNSFKVIQMDDFNYFDHDNRPGDFISDDAIEWLVKIKQLCDGHHVSFLLASPPVSISKKASTSDWVNIRTKTAASPLKNLFERYFSTIIYVDDRYSRDSIHWKADFLDSHRSEFIAEIKTRLRDSVTSGEKSLIKTN